MTLHVRWLVSADLSSILEIEQGSSFPAWSADQLQQFRKGSRSVAIVAIQETGVSKHGVPIGPVQGYLFYEIEKNGYRIKRIAVRKSMLRRGIGSALLRRVANLEMKERSYLSVVVPESSLSTLHFFGAHGFRATHVQREEFGDEDGFFMLRTDDEVASKIRPQSLFKNRISGLI